MRPDPVTSRFAGLTINHDETVLTPRPWTVAQSEWARELLDDVPDGPVLELCAGAGHIGLAAVRDSNRTLVLVDRHEGAVAFAAQNAAAAGIGASIRHGSLLETLDERERFALVLADPPWVPSSRVDEHPLDPRGAIDGGSDGLSVARDCLAVIGRHLVSGGQAVLQLGTAAQADALDDDVTRHGLRLAETRVYERGVLLRIEPAAAFAARDSVRVRSARP